MKKIPQRTCIGCNVKKNKNELMRIVKNKNGEIKIDKTGKLDGRGTYICKSEECLSKAIKNKRMAKTFETEIENSIYENIKKEIIGGDING